MTCFLLSRSQRIDSTRLRWTGGTVSRSCLAPQSHMRCICRSERHGARQTIGNCEFDHHGVWRSRHSPFRQCDDTSDAKTMYSKGRPLFEKNRGRSSQLYIVGNYTLGSIAVIRAGNLDRACGISTFGHNQSFLVRFTWLGSSH